MGKSSQSGDPWEVIKLVRKIKTKAAIAEEKKTQHKSAE